MLMHTLYTEDIIYELLLSNRVIGYNEGNPLSFHLLGKCANLIIPTTFIFKNSFLKSLNHNVTLSHWALV
jgi:hypothetical protein